MATKSHVELDFFGLHSLPHPPQSQPQPRPRLDRRESFRGISKINPEIVKNVIASKYGSPAVDNNHNSVSLPGTPRLGFSQLPVFHPQPQPQPQPGAGSMEKSGETAPMTIFYNGTVSVFDLPHDKAEHVMKLAMEKYGIMSDESKLKSSETTAANTENIHEQIGDGEDDADMPIKRKKSLQRFFEKRKERLVSPYANMEHVSTGGYLQKT